MEAKNYQPMKHKRRLFNYNVNYKTFSEAVARILNFFKRIRSHQSTDKEIMKSLIIEATLCLNSRAGKRMDKGTLSGGKKEDSLLIPIWKLKAFTEYTFGSYINGNNFEKQWEDFLKTLLRAAKDS